MEKIDVNHYSLSFAPINRVDATSKETVKELRVNASQGKYPFRFSDIPKGTYVIVAGTDMNNDARVCDGGEACGAFDE